MFCRKCGKEIPDDSVFCPKCGATVADEKETDSTEPEQDEETSVKEDIVPSENEDSVSIIREINKKIKNDAKESKQRIHKKTASKLLIIAAALAAVVAAALIVFIPQAGIGFEYELVDNDHYAIIKYTGSDTEVTVPDTIWFKPVTIISASAFNGTNITDVKIGKNIIGIGESAFIKCNSLKELDCSAAEMADGSNFLIMDEAFSGCTALKKVTLPNSGIAISNEAFKNCSALEEIKIFGHDSPYYSAAIGIVGKNNKIGARAFEHCTSLKSLALEKVNLGRYAFSECTGLTELWIDGGSLERGEFMGCTQLKSVEIYFSSNSYYPQGISDECFAGCSALENFSGSNISSIGYNAFLNCAELSELNFDPNPTDISDRAFEGCTKLERNSGLGARHEFAATNFVGMPEAEAVKKLGNYRIFDNYGFDWYMFEDKGISFGVGQGTHRMTLYEGAYVASGYGKIDNVQIGMTVGEIFRYIGRQTIYMSPMDNDLYFFSYQCGDITFDFMIYSPTYGFPDDNSIVSYCWVNDGYYD